MYLVFDVTASEKPRNPNAAFSSIHSWPKIVHLSWILLSAEYKPLEDFDCIVSAEDFTYTPEVMKYAKIDEEDVKKKGVRIVDMLTNFNKSVEKCQYVIAHNLEGQTNLLAAEFIRNMVDNEMFKKERICIMQESTYYCKLPSKRGGYKWPSLLELHATCFNSTYTPPNNARADVIAAARCFIKLMKTNQLEDLFEED